MHPRQASLLSDSESILSRVAKRSGKKQSEAAKQGGSNLFKYTCPETEQDFYLPVKQTTVKSPFTGKSFSAKPEKATMADVGKELKEDAAAAKAQKSKKASLLDILQGTVTATEKVASGYFNKDWTITRRMKALHDEFLAQVYEAVEKMEPTADTKLKIIWSGSPNTIVVNMVDAQGQKKTFKLLVDEPQVTAGDILYKYGGY